MGELAKPIRRAEKSNRVVLVQRDNLGAFNPKMELSSDDFENTTFQLGRGRTKFRPAFAPPFYTPKISFGIF